MTVDALIDTVLARIWKEHYEHKRRSHEWHASQRALTKAIARYGYECHGRGWEFEPERIWGELMRILDTMRERSLQIETWFPIYLESAIDRHIRLRADELSAESKREDRTQRVHADPRAAGTLATRVSAGVVVAHVRTPTPVEQLATLYRDLDKRRRARSRTRPAAGAGTGAQLNLI